MPDADVLAVVAVALIGSVVIFAVASVFWDFFQTEAWHGQPLGVRGHIRVWRGKPDAADASIVLARALVEHSPTVHLLSRGHRHALMQHTTKSLPTMLHELDRRDVVVAGRWVHRHGLASLEEHLSAGHTDTELTSFLDSQRMPDPAAVQVLAALSPQRAQRTALLREDVETFVSALRRSLVR